MTYRTILVHVPLGNAKVQVELAAALAKKAGAHLTGLGTLSEVSLLRKVRQNPFLRLEPAKVEELIQSEYKTHYCPQLGKCSLNSSLSIYVLIVSGEGDAAD